MVNNNSVILDASTNPDNNYCEYKNVDEVIKMPYPQRCLEVYQNLLSLCNEYYKLNSEIKIKSIKYGLTNDEKERNRDRMCEILDILPDWINRDLFNNVAMVNAKLHEKLCCEHIMENMDIKPITPAVFINICPSWKGVVPTWNMITKFRRAIQQYCDECNSSRWEKVSYILEDGPDGDHLHFHGVFEINPKQINSVLDGNKSHIRSSKHLRQIRKHLKQTGLEDLVELGGMDIKYNIQTTICRTEEIINDKLKYLDPDSKPIGHGNKTKLMEIEVLDFS